MTADVSTGHRARMLSAIGAAPAPLVQLDVRVHASDAERALPVLPHEPNTWVAWNDRQILWLGPDEWLVVCDGDLGRAEDLTAEFATLLAGTHHSVVDVSASRAAFELSREDRAELLARGCALDLHPRSWREGMCAQTLLARVPVLLQELGDRTRVFVRPSYAGSLLDLLVDAAGASA